MKFNMEEIKFVVGLFLKFADVLPEFIQKTLPVSYDTGLIITEDILNMALRGVKQKRSKHYGNKENEYRNC